MAGRSRGVVLSFLYWSLRRLVELLVLWREKEIEILLLRHQLRVLERQVARPQLARVIGRCLWCSAGCYRARRGEIVVCDAGDATALAR